MPEMYLRDPIVGTYSVHEPFTRHKKKNSRVHKGNINYIYRNELDKASFQHDMTYNKYRNLEKRTQSDKVLKDKAFAIASNLKYDGYQRGLASMVYKFFDKNSKGSGIKNEVKKNQQLTNEIHKPIIRKFERQKIFASYTNNIWGCDLADMQLLSKYNKGIKYLLCVIDILVNMLLLFL